MMPGAKVVTNNRKPLDKSKIKNTEGLPQEDFQRMVDLKGDAESTAAEIRKMGGEAIAFFGDVSDNETARQMIETTIRVFGRIVMYRRCQRNQRFRLWRYWSGKN